ncbi:acyl-CoA dehydrogenase family protein [Paraliomyxa miuraensis]|uniref:acyl-CoA dehydrogenase family protein n=1 Tax=Paraliomyxa miuraensis TaxID=376150 RepID=UPI00225AC924|nr:acyl-CoA dehydrogenase family protein [Paraliomyxa miuraensis]MCX4243001.1 acyl-CoA dehydrogenase family protein [Paraliomyxa miuraensis]
MSGHELSEDERAQLVDRLYALLNTANEDCARECRAWFQANWSADYDYDDEDLYGYRVKTHVIVEKMLNSGLMTLDDLRERPTRFFKLCEQACWVDGSVAATLFAGYLIFGGSLVHLGTERHRKWFSEVDSYEIPACFCMTEVGHGSNLRQVGTIATYDPSTEEFIVNTPSWHDAKWAIALLAHNAKLATVMAQLHLPDGSNKGPHSFLVPIRDDEGKPLPGVRIADCDNLIGLNGVGIGGMFLDHVRIPRENLLNRFSDVTPQGEHVSEYGAANALFQAQVSPLMIERLVPFSSSGCKISMVIATRFARTRRQFGKPGESETAVIDYTTHQRRLMRGFADTYALSFMMERLHTEAERFLPAPIPYAIQPATAAYKAYSYETAMRVIGDARECSSVHSFRHRNKIARCYLDIQGFAHAAGDITVLYQYAARILVGNSARRAAADPFLAPTASHDADGGVLEAQQRLLVGRYQELLEFVRTEFRRQAEQHEDIEDAWNEVLTFAVELGRAYAELITHRQFLTVASTAEHEGAAALLRRLCELHGWTTIARNLGWYADREPPGLGLRLRGLEVEQRILSMSRALIDDVDVLIDAFGIPSTMLPDASLMADLPAKFAPEVAPGLAPELVR